MTTSFRERSGLRWIRADLHLHTPASEDYAEPDISYLDILKEAEQRGLELIAFTDHNSVYGYEQFQREVEFLRTLCNAGRLTAEERTRFEEYDRLLARITILPGFEFTSHYGAHILGIFPPNKPLSLIEATLIQLGVPADRLKEGACGIPDTRHVTDAYEIIARAGGLVIAAHANGPNGVITETLRMGTSGQARVAATQSQYLSALEFINYYTDHDKFTSPAFYNGKTDHYERRMFCIQGSDAHRLRRLSDHEIHAWHKHGIGDRYIELLMPDNSFEALQELFGSKDFDRVRVPKRDQKQWEVDALRFGATSERQILCNIESNADAAAALWKDVAALANMGGGVLTVGCEPGGQVLGVARPDVVSEALRQSIETNLEQQPYISFELISYEGRDVLRVEVKADSLPPYLSKDGVVYVRRDNKTVVANRSEMMQLCRRALAEDGNLTSEDDGLEMPRSGVEIVDDQYRGGIWYYEVRDLRTTAGVTRDKAQGLWAYAISRHEDLREKRIDLHSQVRWRGQLGVWRAYRQGNRIKYDLVHRDANGVITRVFYGVSDWGLGDDWANLLDPREEEVETVPANYENGMSPLFLADDEQEIPNLPDLSMPWGERRYRWRGRGGLLRIFLDENGLVRFDLAMKNKDNDSYQEFPRVPLAKLTEAWLSLIRVPRPRTGIEVVSAAPGEDNEWRYVFRDLRTGDSSGAPWRMQDIKAGTVREYAARMFQQDVPVEEARVRWWGNIGYMRPMRSQVDLLYRDEHGVDHFFYAARRDELQGEWRDLLEIYGEL
ncbi:MAG: PHP domain-containing protein [Chloroflexaceae bacterium]|nr:PHP domain-containing protein [Chloroflexaceae bacterium]NJO04656.1 PHP domain-containing protein [Chloroflexaceae bacterium]